MNKPTYITRVETVVSLQQLEDQSAAVVKDMKFNETSAALAKDTALMSISDIEGLKLPLYSYSSKNSPLKIMRNSSFNSLAVPDVDNSILTRSDSGCDDDANSAVAYNPVDCISQQVVPNHEVGALPEENSVLDTVLMALWEDCSDQGLFRYDVTSCSTKVLPGNWGFIAQLNEGRATQKRPTEFRVDQVVQPFDPKKFNFTKAYMREVLIQFESACSDGGDSKLVESAICPASPTVVLINVSPIDYGHVLLVPRVNDCIQQLVDPTTCLSALRFAMEAANPFFRIGYNSLGAYATINHLHFQAYFLAAPFPCERAPTRPLHASMKRRRGGVRISRLAEYPVNGFVIEGEDNLEDMAAVVGQACLKMQAANIPHNLLICDSGARVFLWPQCYAERQALNQVPEEILETGVNPAAFEIAGHMVLKRKQDYETMSQELAWKMLEQVSLPETRFMEVAVICFGDKA